MTEINQPKSKSSSKVFGVKNLLLASMLGLTLASCGYNDSDRDPRFVDNDDKKEITLPNGDRVWWVKDWSDTGSPYHLKDKDGNRLLGGLDIDSYSDVGDGRFIIITDNQKGIYDFTTNSYVLKLDNYLNINNIWSWLPIVVASKMVWGESQYDLLNLDTKSTLYGQSEPELVTWGNILIKSLGTYKIYDQSFTIVADSWSDTKPEVDSTGRWFVVPSAPILPSGTMILWDSLTAVPSIATWWEFYDIKDAHDSTLVKNCYKPINKWTYVYAVTDDGFVWNSTTKQYKLHQINTITNKDKVRKIDEYEAFKYLP